MAQDLLISLEELKYYDQNIKKYIKQQERIVFESRNNFPIIGNNKVLYIDENKMYIWNPQMSDYQLINERTTGQTLNWIDFR